MNPNVPSKRAILAIARAYRTALESLADSADSPAARLLQQTDRQFPAAKGWTSTNENQNQSTKEIPNRPG
jgi:hypothetical protein